MPAASKPRRLTGWIGSWERRGHGLLPMPAFLRRVAFNLGLGTVFIAMSLAKHFVISFGRVKYLVHPGSG